MEKFFKLFFFLLLSAYRTIGTNHLGGMCRFEPSCSEYARQSLEKHNIFVAIKLITIRLLKCRPGGTYGFDPVPQSKLNIRGFNAK